MKKETLATRKPSFPSSVVPRQGLTVKRGRGRPKKEIPHSMESFANNYEKEKTILDLLLASSKKTNLHSIAELLGVNYQLVVIRVRTIRNIALETESMRLREEIIKGLLNLERPHNRGLNPKEKKILRFLLSKPEGWTLTDLCEFLEVKTGIAQLKINCLKSIAEKTENGELKEKINTAMSYFRKGKDDEEDNFSNDSIQISGEVEKRFCPICTVMLVLDGKTGLLKCNKCGRYWSQKKKVKSKIVVYKKIKTPKLNLKE